MSSSSVCELPWVKCNSWGGGGGKTHSLSHIQSNTQSVLRFWKINFAYEKLLWKMTTFSFSSMSPLLTLVVNCIPHTLLHWCDAASRTHFVIALLHTVVWCCCCCLHSSFLLKVSFHFISDETSESKSTALKMKSHSYLRRMLFTTSVKNSSTGKKEEEAKWEMWKSPSPVSSTLEFLHSLFIPITRVVP